MNQEEVQAAHSVKKKESLPFSVENAQQQILGPDGKPCRACTDFKSWANQMKGGNPGKSVPSMASAVRYLAFEFTKNGPQQVCDSCKKSCMESYIFVHRTCAPRSNKKRRKQYKSGTLCVLCTPVSFRV